MQNLDEKYMSRAIELARLGGSRVAPNPFVGAVIVDENNNIIAEGYHKVFGGDHAEVDAIKNCKDKSLLKNATMYVTLEPCCHFGKTPPCVNAIIEAGIKKVVIAVLDCNPKVCGGGVEVLRQNGIEVIIGMLEDQAREVNTEFFARFK